MVITIILLFTIPAIIGVLNMKKLDWKNFNFLYLVGLLLITFIFLILDGDKGENIMITYLPLGISFASGYVYFAIKNKYFF
ncbi:MAG: hypothetical protein CVV58_04260 [Tenericutes bacterium HGW-Tenericutes-3]|nr:MAG: hypothetical protein CVV58_04260 [Tenericutes bacterium HGW-Tenericutes-3]